MLPFSLYDIAQRPIDPLLEVEGWHNVGISLADQEVVHIEHLAQATHWQILFQRSIPPSPLSLLHRLGIESAPRHLCFGNATWRKLNTRELTSIEL